VKREAAQHCELEAQRQAHAAREREEQALRDAEASELSRQQAEANAARQAEEADALRLADREHRGRINSAILMDLMGLGIEEEKAINLIKHIARNKIEHLAINY
jgi:hypothetical protein